MKATAAYYLVFIYIIAMCKPLLPVAKDVMAHLFWETQHIVTVHHENGQDHLHHEITEAANEKNSDHQAPVKRSEQVSVHTLLQQSFNFAFPLFSADYYASNPSSLLIRISDLDIPPPKV